METITQTASTFTAFDIAVFLIVGLSALFAFGRGFVTTALSFGAWVGTFMLIIFGFTFVQPYGQRYIQPPELADIITLAVLFFVSLFLLKQIAEYIGGKVKHSAVGILDRSLGALFGLLRGMVFVSIAFLAYSKTMLGDDTPEWMTGSRTKPLVAWGAEMVEGVAVSVLGRDPKSVGNDYIEKAADSIPSQFLQEKMEEQAANYLKEQRKNMEEKIGDIIEEEEKNN